MTLRKQKGMRIEKQTKGHAQSERKRKKRNCKAKIKRDVEKEKNQRERAVKKTKRGEKQNKGRK